MPSLPTRARIAGNSGRSSALMKLNCSKNSWLGRQVGEQLDHGLGDLAAGLDQRLVRPTLSSTWRT